MRRRVLWLGTVYIVFTVALGARLFVLSLFPDWLSGSKRQGWLSTVSARADFEHYRIQVADDGRGKILYDDGQVWNPNAAELSGAIGLPDEWPAVDRWVQEQGRSGLQRTFDSWLNGRPKYSGQMKDATGHIVGLSKFETRIEPGYSVRTTIQPTWQQRANQMLRASHVANGAVVILSTSNHGALAVAGIRRGVNAEWVALQDAVPGSVFKLVTAAAALDSYQTSPSRRYVCDGVVHIRGVSMHCWKPHGLVSSIREAIAVSCDVAFAGLGVRMGEGPILAMAERLHLTGNSVQHIDSRSVLAEAKASVVYRSHGANSGAGNLANTAIGQQDVRISPLAAANVACTVADGGIVRDVLLVKDVERDGVPVRRFGTDAGRAFSAPTAFQLASGMRQAITSPAGTAHSLAAVGVAAAVKTGTAELANGRVNSWLVGFAPFDHPTIAFAILVENEPSWSAHRQTQTMAETLLRAVKVDH